MKLLSSGACHYLDEQGFTALRVEEKSKLNIALRFTPTLCSIVVVIGMFYQSWEVFAVLSVFGILGTVTKTWHPFDILYNAIARVFSLTKLLPNPPPKRFACFLGFIFLVGGTISFYIGATDSGYFFGTVYIIAAMLMATTHLCVGSWIYHHILRK